MSTTVQRLRAEMLARDEGKDTLSPGADYRTLREYNHLLVLNCVRLQGPIARVAIAQQTGLSKTTVSNIIDQLLQDDLVIEGDFVDAAPTGGRRPILVHFNAEIGLILGVEVGYTVLTLITTSLSGEVKSVYTEPFDITIPPVNCLTRVATAIRIFMARYALPWDLIIGIGLGIAAPVNVQSRTLVYPPGEHSWQGIDIAANLSQEFGVPVYVDNNANLAALSEGHYGVGMPYNDYVYVVIGQGIGSGLVRNRQVYRGALGAAGEIGHLAIVPDGPACMCGKHGCLETVADNDAIIDDAIQGRTLFQRGKHGSITPRLANQEEVDINDVLHAASQGDPASQQALAQAGRYVGTAVATMISLLNPQAIILDGVAVRNSPIFYEALRTAAEQLTIPTIWAQTVLTIGQLGDLAVALGAASMVIAAAFTPMSSMSEIPVSSGSMSP